jgi:hypothetical protein
MTFVSGQKIVCVKDDDPLGRPTLVVKGAVYTVKSVFICPYYGIPAVTLVGIVQNPAVANGWWVGMFRPAVERKTDISIFTAMLTPRRATKKEPA